MNPSNPQPPSLQGLTVASFESRMSLKIQKLIERYGGKPLLAPALKEVPVKENPKAFQLFDDLEKGKYDLFVLMTGVGTRAFIETLQTKYPKDQIIKILSSVKIVVRGPKPASVCNLNQILISFRAPEPNTWREIISLLSQEQRLKHKRVAVLEYGISNKDFLEELTLAGALVTPVQVYQWALPDDLGPLNKAIEAILEEKVDLALFTTSSQVDHLLKVASDRGDELQLRRALARVGIGSIGPTTSEKLRDMQIFPDFEASPNKMETLVELAALEGKEISKKKKERVQKAWVFLESSSRGLIHQAQGAMNGAPTENSLILKACRREKNSQIPIWLMRQAGRYMIEYHLSRRGLDFLEFCKKPDFTAEATITAVERLGVDAAIIFADILLIVEPMGLALDFKKGEGPTIGTPIRDEKSIQELKKVDVHESLGFVFEAIRKVRSAMHPRIPLIGFCGAPFTVASYMIEGKGSQNSIPTKTLMHTNPKAWHLLLEKITTASIDYLNAQVESGANLIQIFDSWVGCLTPHEYENYVLPHSQRLIQGVKKGAPVIHFGTSTATLLGLMKKAGGDVIGLDWRVEIGSTWDQLGNDVGVQGNFDPLLLFSSKEVIFKEAERILKAVGSRPGFIFNLGHGILPETPVDNVMALIDFVHSWKT